MDGASSRFVEMLRRRFSYLSNIPDFHDTSMVVHITDQSWKIETQRELSKPEAQEAIKDSISLQNEMSLYEHARAVTESQWRELQSCPQRPRHRLD